MLVGLTTLACDSSTKGGEANEDTPAKSDAKKDTPAKDTPAKEAADQGAAAKGEAKGGEPSAKAAPTEPAPADPGSATPTPAAPPPPALATGKFGCSFADKTGSYNRRCKVTEAGEGKWKVDAPGTKLNPDNGFRGTLEGGPDSFTFEGRVNGFDNCTGAFNTTAKRDGERLIAKPKLGSSCTVTLRIKVGPAPTGASAGARGAAHAGAGTTLSIRLTPAPADSGRAFDVDATPAPMPEALSSLDGWNCADTLSAPPPCGWASQCADLARRWGKQIGAAEAGEEAASADYAEDCGDDGDVPYESKSEDFVDHAAVMRHELGALAEDGVSGIFVQKMSGWHGLARIREVAVEGMSARNEHEPVAAWSLDLDGTPGKELAVLVTGLETSGADIQRKAHLVVCRAVPEVACRRIDLGSAKTVEARSGGSFVVDGGAAKAFNALGRADQRLIGTGASGASAAAGGGGNARCKVTSGSQTYDGRCTFKPDGSNGSFSVSPVGAADIHGANPLMVSVVEPGVAEVRGLTSDGISSRWGEAKRSTSDRSCWAGDGFSVCAYGSK